MPRSSFRTRLAAVLAVPALALTGLLTVGTWSAHAATCRDVDVVFARGTGETPALGILGRPLVSALASSLSGCTVSSYAVDYAASSSQTSAGPGATDMSTHLRTVAAECPGTRFVIGGYSQGATVTDDLRHRVDPRPRGGRPGRQPLRPRVRPWFARRARADQLVQHRLAAAERHRQLGPVGSC